MYNEKEKRQKGMGNWEGAICCTPITNKSGLSTILGIPCFAQKFGRISWEHTCNASFSSNIALPFNANISQQFSVYNTWPTLPFNTPYLPLLVFSVSFFPFRPSLFQLHSSPLIPSTIVSPTSPLHPFPYLLLPHPPILPPSPEYVL